MARMIVTLDGRTSAHGTPLLMHHGRLADPLDPYALRVAEISKKRGKTEADYLELSRREFEGSMYHDEELGPFIPVWHVVRCIQNAGKQHKLGATVLRGVVPAVEKAALQYDGPRDIEGMWRDGRFALRNTVGVGSSRTTRTRPVFEDWQLEAEIEVDLTQINPEKVNQLVEEAGRYQGLGDYRPVHGRFTGTAVLLKTSAAKRGKAVV